MLGSWATFADSGSFVRNEFNLSKCTKLKIKAEKSKILSLVLLLENIFFCHLNCTGMYMHVVE